MNEDKLTKEEERLLAELAESKYFDALEHLKNTQAAQGVSSLLTKTLPNEELRYWQGFVAGVAAIPELIKQIRDKVHKEGFRE